MLLTQQKVDFFVSDEKPPSDIADKLPEEFYARRKTELENEWELWAAAGEAATLAARRELHQKGIGFAYLQNGVVMEELPDGTVHVVTPSAEAVNALDAKP